MKEIFQNSVGFNTVEIAINCAAGNLLLNYQLSDNPVQHIWQNIHNNSTEFEVSLSVNSPKEIILEKLNHICKNHNLLGLNSNFTSDDLNRIHNEMAKLIRLGIDVNSLDTLNKCVHILESHLRNKYIQYNSNVTFYKKNDTTLVPVKEEYKLWLEPNLKWGDLVLGYGTLGKDWLDIFVDNDNVEDLVIQSTISSETCLVFRTEYNYPKALETLFYRYAKSSNTNPPLENLNKLALGRYFLGKLIIDDTLLQYHNIIGDWYIPNHICKLNWNKDVIGSNVIVKNMRFYNDSKFQEMSIEHAKIRPII
jgi:hypothetical protein